MANICENKFYIFAESEETINEIEIRLQTLFKKHLSGEITYSTNNILEGYFDSKWDFPMNYFEGFFKGIDDDTIYMRCLSEEYGVGIVSMNVYDDGNWWEPQYFNI